MDNLAYSKVQPEYPAQGYTPASASFQPHGFSSEPAQPIHQQGQNSNISVRD